MPESEEVFTGILPPLEAPDDDEPSDEPRPPPSWPEIRFELMWLQHGGSGLGMSPAAADDLDLADALWLYNTLAKRRERESERLKRAAAAARAQRRR